MDCRAESNTGKRGRLFSGVLNSLTSKLRLDIAGRTGTSRFATILEADDRTPSTWTVHVPARLNAASAANVPSGWRVALTLIGPIPFSTWVSFTVAALTSRGLLSLPENARVNLFWPRANGSIVSFTLPVEVYSI